MNPTLHEEVRVTTESECVNSAVPRVFGVEKIASSLLRMMIEPSSRTGGQYVYRSAVISPRRHSKQPILKFSRLGIRDRMRVSLRSIPLILMPDHWIPTSF